MALCNSLNIIQTSLYVSNVNSKTNNCMMVWKPHGNKMFETFSYLPPLTDNEIEKQIQHLLDNNWVPCIEFEDKFHAYADSHGIHLDSSINSGYYDNRYWVMWKLPMFGCTEPRQVLSEIKSASDVLSDCYIRICGFDNIRQVQCASFIVHRPKNDNVCNVNERQYKSEQYEESDIQPTIYPTSTSGLSDREIMLLRAELKSARATASISSNPTEALAKIAALEKLNL